MKGLLFLFILIGVTQLQAQPDYLSSLQLSVDELKEDFRYYRKLLEETHPGLYRYTSAEAMHKSFDSVEYVLNIPLPFYSFYKIVAATTASIRCAHTHALPTADFRKHLNSLPTLPFFLYPIEGRLYVVFNGSTDETIGLGYELLRINHHSADSVIKVLKRHFWADGFTDLSKNAVLQGSAFCYFYHALIEQTDQFELLFRAPDGKEHTIKVSGQSFAVSEKGFIQKPVNQKAVKLYNRSFKTPWRLSFPDDVPTTAMLRFDGFGGKGVHSTDDAREAMQKFMNKSMKEIDRKKCQNLIIDVRDNAGGWDAQGIELFSYLTKSDHSFRYYRNMYTATNNSEFLKFSDMSVEDLARVKDELQPASGGGFSMKEVAVPELQPQQPKTNRFKGSVFILMNERTSSAASELVALCRSKGVGVIVGSEAGGAYEGGNSGSFIHVSLPHSKIRVTSPLVKYENAVTPLEPSGRGTLPDHFVTMQPDDLLTRFDRPLEFVKDLIRQAGEKK